MFLIDARAYFGLSFENARSLSLSSSTRNTPHRRTCPSGRVGALEAPHTLNITIQHALARLRKTLNPKPIGHNRAAKTPGSRTMRSGLKGRVLALIGWHYARQSTCHIPSRRNRCRRPCSRAPREPCGSTCWVFPICKGCSITLQYST